MKVAAETLKASRQEVLDAEVPEYSSGLELSLSAYSLLYHDHE